MPVYEFEVDPLAGNGCEPRGTLRNAPDTVELLRNELDEYWKRVKRFATLAPSDVLLEVSAMVARAGEVRGLLIRSDNRAANAFRTRELDPFIDQCELQFRIHSRLLASHELDAKLAGGQP